MMMIKNQNTINIARNISQTSETSLLNITGPHLLVLTPSKCYQCLTQETLCCIFLEFLLLDRAYRASLKEPSLA